MAQIEGWSEQAAVCRVSAFKNARIETLSYEERFE